MPQQQQHQQRRQLMGPFFFPDLLLDGCQVDSNSPFGSLLSNYLVSQSHTLLPAYLRAFMFLLELPVYFPGKKTTCKQTLKKPLPFQKHHLQHDTHLHLSGWSYGNLATDLRYGAGSLNKKSLREISETNAEESNKVRIKMPDWLEGGKLCFFFPSGWRHSVVSSRCSPSDKGEAGGGSNYPPHPPSS